MHENGYWAELGKFLKERPRKLDVVVMPDFFLDRLVSLQCDVKSFSESIQEVARNKGGSIDNVTQTELRGGNAINTASALSALDVRTTPIICTDTFGRQIIESHFSKHLTDLSHIKVFNRASVTTALELKGEHGTVNIMLRNLGSLADFGPQHLDTDDFRAIERADYVCTFNWAGTKRFGTELAETVFRHVKTKGKGKTYYDTADPTPNKRETPELMRTILQSNLVDILSVNENEAILWASLLDDKITGISKDLPLDQVAKEAARILALRLSARIDLHTTSFSVTITSQGEIAVPAFKVPILRATGAGDAWNAGNIVGDAYGLSDGCRLTLANAVAAYYISNPEGAHPTRGELKRFCRRAEQKKIR